ncbi:hypothetical protein V1478_005637 [Vespula squamosa]|uniref:Uncharacterized protein n=1 Tax=Vespula squamosa TaxID=30214 RepID=A0ABD2BAI8_VESSQ
MNMDSWQTVNIYTVNIYIYNVSDNVPESIYKYIAPSWTSASFDIFVFDVYEYVDIGRHILCKYQNCIPYNSLQYSKLETILLYHSH